jgi:hypothetical protein
MEHLHRFLENKGANQIPREAIQVFDILLKNRPGNNFLSIQKATGT